MKHMLKYSMLALTLFSVSCQENSTEKSSIKVTSVKHTTVKRQSIGNCWLYAQATWLESLLKDTNPEAEEVNVSETYWTYWDLYHKLIDAKWTLGEELSTGGNWTDSTSIINAYGWVTEGEFIESEATETMSEAQACAEDYITEQGKEGGTLFDASLRTKDHVRAELDKAFSCDGKYAVDMESALKKARKASETMLIHLKDRKLYSLTTLLANWKQVPGPSYSTFEGKKLISEGEYTEFRNLEQRIKKALNDHYPVVMSFYVAFNAPNEKGIFNLNTLAEKGSLGTGGGHMVVFHDYTVDNVPTDDGGFISLSEGDLDPQLKSKALLGDLNYLVAKNSWGANRADRPWIGNGYSRFTWEYLQHRYWDEDRQKYYPIFRSVVLPPRY